jgi:hypothetical protein
MVGFSLISWKDLSLFQMLRFDFSFSHEMLGLIAVVLYVYSLGDGLMQSASIIAAGCNWLEKTGLVKLMSAHCTIFLL